jgi:CubicO group peptidase (beta-lactamase class C family)
MGIDKSKVDALLARARREVDEGLLPSTQVALAYEGELVAFEAFGDATLDTRYAVFSCTKAFVASTVWTVIGEGLVDPSKLVIDYIPEFGTNGKDVITVEQVMLHTAGFPHAPLGAPQWWTREGRVQRFAEWRLNWEPGTRYEYHATSAHWVLGEIIDRVTGSNFCDELERRVTGPLGLPREGQAGRHRRARPRRRARHSRRDQSGVRHQRAAGHRGDHRSAARLQPSGCARARRARRRCLDARG